MKQLAPTHARDVALLGVGAWGRNLARNFFEIGALRTLCDPSPAAQGLGREFVGVGIAANVAQVLVDPEIRKVVIATPAASHFGLARSALLADKDVFVEKPICLDEAEAEELVALAEERGRILMVGHLLQYHPCIERLLALVAQGELGRLHYITSNRLNLGRIRHEENALWSFAPHDISVILALAGSEVPAQVRCLGESYLRHGVADTTITTLKFASGVRAHVYVSWLNPFKEQKLTVVGSRGMAVFDDTRPWGEKLVLFKDYLTWAGGQTPTPSRRGGEPEAVPESEPLRNECEHFLARCSDRVKPKTDGVEGLRVLRVLQAAQRSLDLGGEAANAAAVSAPVEYFRHPSALVDEGAVVGKGSRIWHWSHVSRGARVGERCSLGQNVFVANGVRIGSNVKIQNNVSVYEGVTLEDNVFCGPSMVFTNVKTPRCAFPRNTAEHYAPTLVRHDASIGANATIVCGITVGQWALIAAGAVVTKDVPAYALMAGVPARRIGWACQCGQRLDGTKGTVRCAQCDRIYDVDPNRCVPSPA